MNRLPPKALSPPLLALLALAGCAAPTLRIPVTAVVEADPVEPDGPAKPPVAVPAPRKKASEPPEGPPVDGILLRFAAEARAHRAAAAPGRGVPEAALASWAQLCGELDRYLQRPLPQTPLLELVRARVTVEAELEYDRRRYGPQPAALLGPVKARLDQLARRTATVRALRQTLKVKHPRPARLTWPIADAGISSLYGMRRHPIDGRPKMHRGLDLAARKGRVVTSAARGFVVQAGFTSGYGLMVEVRHGGDLTTRYSHLSRLLCSPGDPVDEGQALGLVGATGKATGPHLHFEVWTGGVPRDPLALLGARPPGDGGD